MNSQEQDYDNIPPELEEPKIVEQYEKREFLDIIIDSITADTMIAYILGMISGAVIMYFEYIA